MATNLTSIDGQKFQTPNLSNVFNMSRGVQVTYDAAKGVGNVFGGVATGLTEEIGQSLQNVGRAAGATVQETFYGIGKGIESVGKSGGLAIQSLGTDAGKGVTNFAVGAVPAALLALGFVLIFAVAKRV